MFNITSELLHYVGWAGNPTTINPRLHRTSIGILGPAYIITSVVPDASTCSLNETFNPSVRGCNYKELINKIKN